jgi:hypothetical protein
MLIEGKMAGIEGEVGGKEETHPFKEVAFDPRSVSPEKPMVYEQYLRPSGMGPANALGAGVHGEGDRLDRASGAADLDTIEGIVEPCEALDLEEGATPMIEGLNIHLK